MTDSDRSPEELKVEIKTLRARVAQLERAEAERQRTEEAMRQEQVQTHLDVAGVVLLALNKRGEITQINRKGCAVLGYEEGELIGKNWVDTCLPARHRKAVREVFEKLMVEGIEATAYYENPVLTKTGEQRIIAWHNTLLTDEAGQVVGTLSSGEDVTERKQTEEELNRRVKHSRSLQRVAQSLTANLELEDILREVVHAVAEVFEVYDSILVSIVDDDQNLQAYALDETSQGRVVGDLGFPDQPLDKTATGHVVKTGQPLVRRDLPREATFPFDQVSIDLGRHSQMFVPLVSGGQVIGTLYVGCNQPNQFGQDEVELLEQIAASLAVAIRNAQLYQALEDHNESLEQTIKERTAELEATNEHLLALSHLKDQFVSNVSHELRTPIAGLMLYHSLLKAGPPEKRDHYLAALGRETERLNNIIEDLLRLSRLDREAVEVNPTTVDLNALARQYVADRTPLAQSRGLALSLDTHPTPPTVQADEGLLGQALSVLLTNALNYTPQGGQIVVSTGTRQEEGRQWAAISVADTGPGIPPGERQQIFERFFRGRAGRDSRTPGTGLGLAIAAEIIRLHQGRIEVESDGQPGQGATFTLWLPVAE